MAAVLALAVVTGASAWAVGGHDAAGVDEQRRDAADVVVARFEFRTAALIRSLELDPAVSPPASPAALRIDRVATSGTTRQLWPAGIDGPPTPITAETRVAMELARDLGLRQVRPRAHVHTRRHRPRPVHLQAGHHCPWRRDQRGQRRGSGRHRRLLSPAGRRPRRSHVCLTAGDSQP